MQNDARKLSLEFESQDLVHDLQKCLEYPFIDHFNKRDYNGSWQSISLRSLDGTYDNIFAYGSDTQTFSDTPLLAKCPYFQKIITSFKCQKQSIRLLNLKSKSRIKEHVDYKLAYEEGAFRIHIPIITNEQVAFHLNNRKLTMRQGECWYANFSLSHKVENNGHTDRIHLVMDCLRNSWSDRLFRRNGYDFSLEKYENPVMDTETTLKVIKELDRMDTPSAITLIQKLKRSLDR